MLAIGGCIGTGLFIASGSALSAGGPGGALVSYIVMGIAVYFVMTALGELASYMPVEGSFSTYMTRFLDPAAGFAIGWNYWFSYNLMVSSELLSVGLIIEFWLPHIHGAVWSIVCLVLLFAINSWSVRSFGEIEYWMSLVKVIGVLAFIIVGFITDSGKLGGHKYAFENWKIEGAPFANGAKGTFNALIFAIFSFLGTEMLGMSAAESKNPRKDVPRAIHTVFFRILLFYIGSILVIGMIIPWNDENLLNAHGVKDVAISPFTLIFERAGLGAAVHVVNAIILVTVISAGNSGLYACTRMLHAMASSGKAPAIFRRCTKRGVPIWSLLFVLCIAMILFGISFIGNQIVYSYILNISTLMGLITWMSIIVSHVRFRMAMKAQGVNIKGLPYRDWWYPFGDVYAVVAILITVVGQGWAAAEDHFDAPRFVTTYLGLILFFVLYFAWKWFKKTRIIPLADVDLYSGSVEDPNYLSAHHVD
ncbi:APC family amino acid-polyamine-organocation transporter [Martensiomyces pterosporus]|nr:APC family amino acid-polyamine-organocation transporter [Martensiomyces pterosporus]